MQKTIATLLFIVVVSFTSTAAYIYFSTKSAVDSVIHSVYPFIDIRYQSFTNPMDGSISIHGVSISDQDDISIDIGSIELQLDSALDYIDFNRQLNSGSVPEKLQLSVNNAYADLDLLTQLSEKPGKFERISSYIAALGCGDINKITMDNFSDLGYSGVDGSINLSFNYNKYTSVADIEAELILHDMESYSFKTSIPNIKKVYDFSNPDNESDNLTIEVQDLGYNKKLSDFCSKESGVDNEQYVEQHMQGVKNYLTTANIALSEDIYNAYRAYFVDQANIKFTVRPESAVNLKYINLFEIKDWPKVLGLKMYANDKKIDDLSLAWNKDVVVKDLLNAQVDPNSTNGNTTTSKKDKGKQRKFVNVAAASLNNYVNSKVKLESKLGKSYEGRIIGIRGGQIVMEVKLHGGKVELPIDLDEIVTASVYK